MLGGLRSGQFRALDQPADRIQRQSRIDGPPLTADVRHKRNLDPTADGDPRLSRRWTLT